MLLGAGTARAIPDTGQQPTRMRHWASCHRVCRVRTTGVRRTVRTRRRANGLGRCRVCGRRSRRPRGARMRSRGRTAHAARSLCRRSALQCTCGQPRPDDAAAISVADRGVRAGANARRCASRSRPTATHRTSRGNVLATHAADRGSASEATTTAPTRYFYWQTDPARCFAISAHTACGDCPFRESSS